jgi:hypothetical protein
MGSPLSPLLVNIFMAAFEVEAIDSSPMKPKCRHRYLDDVFAIWPHGQAALKDFLGHLNPRHPNITLSMKVGRDRQLPFLDVMVNRHLGNSLKYAVYRKATHTDRQAASPHPPAHKRSVITTLRDGANTICDEAGPQIYNRLDPFSESTVAPCRIPTDRPNLHRPGEVPKTVTTGHTSHAPNGQLIASPGYCRNTASKQYRNQLTKWSPNSIPLKTGNSRLESQVFTSSRVPVARCTSDKPAATSPPGLLNT